MFFFFFFSTKHDHFYFFTKLSVSWNKKIKKEKKRGVNNECWELKCLTSL